MSDNAWRARTALLDLLSLAPDGDDKIGSERGRREVQRIADSLLPAPREPVFKPVTGHWPCRYCEDFGCPNCHDACGLECPERKRGPRLITDD